MNFLKISGVLAAIGLVTACATFQERVYPYHASIYSWLGASIDEAVEIWGPAEAVSPLEGGRQAYFWPGKGGAEICPTTLITDAKGKIVNFNPGGTQRGCAKTEPWPRRPRAPQ